jgi:small subunit ribosomal protein S8
MQILYILKDEGYITDFSKKNNEKFVDLEVQLKYAGKKDPVIKEIQRVSRPGRRVYMKAEEIKPEKSNLGIAIMSTSKGIITSKKAKKLNVGGEVICKVS